MYHSLKSHVFLQLLHVNDTLEQVANNLLRETDMTRISLLHVRQVLSHSRYGFPCYWKLSRVATEWLSILVVPLSVSCPINSTLRQCWHENHGRKGSYCHYLFALVLHYAAFIYTFPFHFYFKVAINSDIFITYSRGGGEAGGGESKIWKKKNFHAALV